MSSILRFCVAAIWITSSAAFAQTARWEPGKVIAVDQVSSPAKTPDADCHTMPRGETLPPRCRPYNLRAQKFWSVKVDVGNKRYVVRPYRAPKFIDSLNQDGPIYVDPHLTAGSPVEVALYANKSMRLRTDKGEGLPATVDSEEVLSQPDVALRVETPAAPRAVTVPVPQAGSKVVLLQDGDFIDLEVQELKAQDIGDGAVLYSFAGDSAQTRIRSSKPVFLVMGTVRGNVELARLQVGKGSRQLLYSAVKKHSASSLAVTVTQVSDMVQRVGVSEPLAAGEYVFLMEDSNRAYLFEAR